MRGKKRFISSLKIQAVVSAILVVLALSGNDSAAFATGTYSFGPSGVDGAGFQNVVAIQPGNSDYVLSGADVAGIQLSQDGGATWTLSNKGLETIPKLKVASLAFLNSSTVFAAVGGQGGTGGGLYESTDAGLTWTLFSGTPTFSGANNTSVAQLPSTEHPRSTGNLIVFDSTGTYVYAGTFKDGVYRCTIASGSCTSLGMSGLYIRSLAIDPLDDNVLYAAAYDDDTTDPNYASKTGVFKYDAGGSATFAKITSPTLANDAYYIEELKFIGNNMMYAVGKDKNGVGTIYKVQNKATTWTAVDTVSGTNFESVDGYWNSGLSAFVILAGAANGAAGNQSILQSLDGGSTWNAVTAETGTGSLVGGGTWWLSQDDPPSMMNESTYVAAHIAFSSTSDHTAYVAGRAGVWKSTDNGATWNPAVRHMNVTFNRSIVDDPNTGNVYTADTDWQFLWSTDQMDNVRRNKTNIPSATGGTALAVNSSTSPSKIYLGVGNRNSNINGGVYSSTDPTNSTAGWTSENLDSTHASGYNGERVLGLAAKSVSGTPYLLAAVEKVGIFRKVGSNWTLVSSSVLANPATKNAPLVWDPTRPYAYLYDRETGVWRGSSNGSSWGTAPVYSAATASVNGSETGYLALDSSTNTLYISNDSGLYYQSGASTASFSPVKITLPTGVQPGPIAFANGQLYVCGLATNTGTPSVNPTANIYTYTPSAGIQSVGDSFYKANAGFPVGIDVDSLGNIYVAMQGQGVIVGK